MSTKNTPHFRVDNDFIDSGIMSDISGDDLKVYLTLFRRSNSGKNLCFCGYANLAIVTGIDINAIPVIVKSLQEKGFLNINSIDEHGKSFDCSVYSYENIIQNKNAKPNVIMSLQENIPNPYDNLIKYCATKPELSMFLSQLECETPTSELSFLFQDELTQVKIDQFNTGLLYMIKGNDIDEMDKNLIDFNESDILKVKGMYAVACALRMDGDEIRQRSFKLTEAGYIEWIEKQSRDSSNNFDHP